MQKSVGGWSTTSAIVLLGFVWVVLSVISDSSSESNASKRDVISSSATSYGENVRIDSSEDGYEWAEENDISSFEECQGQFGTSYEEDECNRYVRENSSDYNTFKGFECTEDCSGHEAGYNWAEENGISDESDCQGNSNSFNEGCQAYIDENY